MDLIRLDGNTINIDDEGYICLTDLAKAGRPDEKPGDTIKNWLRTQNTVEFLSAWESLNNPNFKEVDLHLFKDATQMSVAGWIEKTDAKGIYSKIGKYGGTYAHKDIAFEFGAHISALFKLHIIKEYQRLKELENNIDNMDWQVRRVVCRENYTILTDSVKKYKIPFNNIQPSDYSWAYAEEGDVINLALFGFTAATWRKYNVTLAAKQKNVRDFASTNELKIISILEGMNADMIKYNVSYSDRLTKLKEVVKEQLPVLDVKDPMKSLKKATDGSFQALYVQDGYPLGMFPQIPFAKYVQGKIDRSGTNG